MALNHETEELLARLLAARQQLDHAPRQVWGAAPVIALAVALMSLLGNIFTYFGDNVSTKNMVEYTRSELKEVKATVEWMRQHGTWK